LLLTTFVFTCEVWTDEGITSEQGFKQFKTKLENINANNLALMVLVKERTQTNQMSLEVVQVWQDYYSGGFQPFDLIQIDCSEDVKCEDFTLGEEYFVILGSGDDTDKKIVIAHLKLPNNSMSSRNKFIRNMTATACGSMEGCVINVASYPPERNQTLDYEQGPRLTVWCPGKKDVQWFCKYTPSSNSTWNKVNGSSGMRVGKNNQHLLKTQGQLQNQHTDYEYECRDTETLNDNPITRFLLQIGKQIQNSNEYCECQNGGTCLKDGTCQCDGNYGGELCDQYRGFETVGYAIGYASQVLSANTVYIICLGIISFSFLCAVLSCARNLEYFRRRTDYNVPLCDSRNTEQSLPMQEQDGDGVQLLYCDFSDFVEVDSVPPLHSADDDYKINDSDDETDIRIRRRITDRDHEDRRSVSPTNKKKD